MLHLRSAILFASILAPACSPPPAARPVPAATAAPAPADPSVPAVFAPGVISGPSPDSGPAFSPDGDTVYFTRDDAIAVSHRRGGTWSEPEVAPFSGRWGDWEPAMAPDGSFLIFASNRPAHEPGAALDGEWGYPKRETYPGHGANLWRVERNGDGWGAPVRLPDTVNRGTGVWEPWIVGDGSLYFMDAHVPGRFRIYRSQLDHGTYAPAEPVPFSDGTWSDVDPTVAPDESFIVIASNRPPMEGKGHDLYVALRTEGGWGPLVHLDAPVSGPTSNEIEPRLGPDHHTLYFTTDRTAPSPFPRELAETAAELRRGGTWNNGGNNIWQVDLAPSLARIRAGS